MMAASCMASKLVFILMLTLFVSSFLAEKPTENPINDVSSIFAASKLDIRSYPSRNSGLSRRYKTSCSTLPCLKIVAGIHLIKFSLAAGYFVLLANDVNLNPGSVAGSLVCPWCIKVIRKNQARLQCVLCEVKYHLKCLGADYDQNGCCHLCSVQPGDLSSDSPSHDEMFLPSKLRELVKLRGFKIVHQNIRSLERKIDEVRVILKELN